jgi:hypothetical protein
VRDERLRGAVLEDVGDLGADEVPVDRHDVEAGLDRGEERGQHGRAVGHLDREAVADPQSRGAQPTTDPVGLGGEFGVRHDPAVRLHDGGPLRIVSTAFRSAAATGDGPQSDGGHARECITRSNQ